MRPLISVSACPAELWSAVEQTAGRVPKSSGAEATYVLYLRRSRSFRAKSITEKGRALWLPFGSIQGVPCMRGSYKNPASSPRAEILDRGGHSWSKCFAHLVFARRIIFLQLTIPCLHSLFSRGPASIGSTRWRFCPLLPWRRLSVVGGSMWTWTWRTSARRSCSRSTGWATARGAMGLGSTLCSCRRSSGSSCSLCRGTMPPGWKG